MRVLRARFNQYFKRLNKDCTDKPLDWFHPLYEIAEHKRYNQSEKGKKDKKQWYQDNKEHRKEYRKTPQYKKYMKEYMKKYMKQWLQDHPEYMKEYMKDYHLLRHGYGFEWWRDQMLQEFE